MPRLPRFVTAFLLLALSSAPPAHAAAGPPQELDDYIVKALEQWQIPGLALAVIKDDKVVLTAGFYADFALADGKVTSMTLTQPSQPKLTLERKK